jgi:bacillolysin
MYYGTGFAVADDVVGHEMTHGVTERSSNLLYWGQSGAMNESISDIMGEIVDHQNVTASDGTQPVPWSVGEDIPGFPNGIRNMQNPTLPPGNDPDKMTSGLYVKQICSSTTCYSDEDGVHSNSGVGNHTFYLASQGGTFNGQTITGIDTGDANLTKSAKLWLLTDQTLTSGSDYADEAAVLEQSCAALQSQGVMTAANCAAVHQATLATELRTTPTNNPQPADATATCPAGTTLRTLFDSESGTPAAKFIAGAGWSRDGIPGWGQVAHSAPGAWTNDESATSASSSLTATTPIALPAGQASYLFFQQWRVLDYVTDPLPGDTGFYDGGTVEINGAATANGSWVNGPTDIMSSVSGNPIGGQKAFGGDSRGYLASRLDLSSFAGQSVTPRFTMNTDSSFTIVGWGVDDIQLYTCDKPKVGAGVAKIKGKPVVGNKLKAKTSGWSPAGVTFTYQWLRNGKAIKGATSSKYKLKNKDKGKRISVVVTGSAPNFHSTSVTSKQTKKVKPRRHHH